RPLRYGVHFWLSDGANVLLRRRPPRGLLGGMSELPGPTWRAEPWSPAEIAAAAPMPAQWRPAGEVRHGFTHFELRIAMYAAEVARIDAEGVVTPLAALEGAALPGVMRKCIAAVVGGGPR
ncbi:MAG: NUDIX domain-containing protein, partial [Chthoniobacter sp.]|nr:NUDIX domain-containing protein [Chthoniobacter sp.]